MQLADYLAQHFVKHDSVLEHINQTIANHEMPPISVTPEVGQMLTLLVRISGARQLLEIGALAGYSGICLLRGLNRSSRASGHDSIGDPVLGPISEGHLTSLELNPMFAEVASANLTEAGYGNNVTYQTGPALDSLTKLESIGAKFDFFFIDADKGNYRNYLERAIRLANEGALIVADNVLRGGRVLDASDAAPSTVAIRAFNAHIGRDQRLETMLLPLGDGLTIARVR